MSRRIRLVLTALIMFLASVQMINAAEYDSNLSGYSEGGISFIESDEYKGEKPNKPIKPEDVEKEIIGDTSNKGLGKQKKLPQTGERQNIRIAVIGLLVVLFTVLAFKKRVNNRT